MARMSTAFVALAALCWGLAGGIGGMLMAEGWGPAVVSFYRGAIGLLFVLAWLLVRPGGSGLARPRLWGWSVVAGLGVAGNFFFYLTSLAESSIAVAATLMYCAPVFVYLLSFALKLERPTPSKWVSMALVLLGILLLTRVYETGAYDITLLGIVTGLLAGVSYAVFIFGFKRAAAHGSPQAILSIAFALLVIVLAWGGDTGEKAAVLTSTRWPLFATLGVLGAGLSFILYILGLRATPPTVASIVAMVEPITAALFGVALLSQDLSGLQILGMGLILVAVTTLGAKEGGSQRQTRWVTRPLSRWRSSGARPSNAASIRTPPRSRTPHRAARW
ncbi:MAG: DMT family transporter [Chromatiaceae bacterium]|nr:DMT family transporter [Chromatiaceae bacterium]